MNEREGLTYGKRIMEQKLDLLRKLKIRRKGLRDLGNPRKKILNKRKKNLNQRKKKQRNRREMKKERRKKNC